jgi:hypothetical protein
VERWRYEGEGEVTEPKGGDLKRPGAPTMPGEDRIANED